MPRIGQKNSNKQTENGRLYFGEKDQEYLKQVSRQAVEEHHNVTVLYFELDWEKSKRNFYGEMLVKKIKNPHGVEVRCAPKLKQNEQEWSTGLANKQMSLIVSVYVEHLKELNINPQRGDYFTVGKRIYQIHDKTIEDVGPGNLILGRERIRQDFFCYQEQDEAFQKDIFAQAHFGVDIDIRPGLNNV
jgi:hypothetical protein